MNDRSDLDAIEPGMPVIGVDGEPIGTVESVHPASIRVADREIPREVIAEVTDQGVQLRLAKAALLARRDPDVEGVGGTGVAFTMPNGGNPRNG